MHQQEVKKALIVYYAMWAALLTTAVVVSNAFSNLGLLTITVEVAAVVVSLVHLVNKMVPLSFRQRFVVGIVTLIPFVVAMLIIAFTSSV